MLRSLQLTLFASASLLLSVGCAGSGATGAFSYRFPDNQAEPTQRVVDAMPASTANNAPGNTLGQPVAVASTHGEDRQIVAWNLSSGSEIWSAAGNAMTRPEILGDVVVYSDRNNIIALDLTSGQQLWQRELEGPPFVGASREGDRITIVQSVGAAGGATRLGEITCLNARTGREFWSHFIQGVLGQPAMQGGHVFVPWDRQQVAILDTETGLETARFRSTDDVISWVEATSAGVFYGARGIYRFTLGSHTGTQEGAIYRGAPVADAPREPLLQADGFFPKPGTRSARGRIRFYSSMSEGTGLDPVDDRFYLVYFRYVFAYNSAGNLQWTAILDQDVINAQVISGGLLTIGEEGAVRTLSAANGQIADSTSINRPLASVGLDAAGMSVASSDSAPVDIREALNAVIMDPDNRLVPARAYAITLLSQVEDPEVTRDLLDLYEQRAMPVALRESIGESLRERSAGLEFLVQALDREYDFLDETRSPPLELIVPSLLENESGDALPGLIRQLMDHETPLALLPLVARAIVDLGDSTVVAPLQNFLTRYRFDSTFAEDPQTLIVAAEGLFRHGGVEGRELIQAYAAEASVVEPLKLAIEGYFTTEREAEERRVAAEAAAAAAAAAEAARVEVAQRPLRLSQEQINESIAAQADPLRTCIRDELARNARLAQVRVTFIIDGPEGVANLSFAPRGEEFVGCMTPIMEAVEFPAFRQRRQRATFIVSVRGENRVQEGASPALASDAPWWAFNQARAEASGATTPPSARAWWMPRPASVPLNTTTPATTTTAEPSGSLWWMQRQPAAPEPTTPDTANAVDTTDATSDPAAEGTTEPAAAESTTAESTTAESTTAESTEAAAAAATEEDGEEPTEDGSEEPAEGTETEEAPAEETPAAPAEEVPWWMPQE